MGGPQQRGMGQPQKQVSDGAVSVQVNGDRMRGRGMRGWREIPDKTPQAEGKRPSGHKEGFFGMEVGAPGQALRATERIRLGYTPHSVSAL